jgi:hypothetical protein
LTKISSNSARHDYLRHFRNQRIFCLTCVSKQSMEPEKTQKPLPTRADAIPQHSVVVPGAVQGRAAATSANYDDDYDDVQRNKHRLTETQVHDELKSNNPCQAHQAVVGGKEGGSKNPIRRKQLGGIILHDSLLLKQWLP